MKKFEFSKRIKLYNKIISPTSPCIVIAEVGINHNGNINLAKKHIKAAAESGADIVKFQTFKTEEFMADKNLIYEYKDIYGKTQKENMYDMFKKTEFTESEYKILIDYTRQKNIIFLSTPCDIDSFDMLMKLGVKAVKISSEDLINIRFIEYVAKSNITTILSTGMADEKEISIALDIFKKHKNNKVILLHCTSVYPVQTNEVNLNRMKAIADKFNILTGFSDHTDKSLAAIGAIYMNAVIIEKHFTLSKKLKGPDHSFSIEPTELKQLIENIRYSEKIKGKYSIEPTATEKKMRLKFRRSIVASKNLEKGDFLKFDDINFKRPGNGLKPYEQDKILGKKLLTSIPKDKQILPKHIKP